MIPNEAIAAAKRDELAALIWGVEADEVGAFKTGVTSKAADDIADAILAAGWRPPTPPAHAIECSRPTPSGAHLPCAGEPRHGKRMVPNE